MPQAPASPAAAENNGPPLELGKLASLNFHPIQQGFAADGREYQVAYEPQKQAFLVTLKNRDGTWIEETVDWGSRRKQPGAKSKFGMDLGMMYQIKLIPKQLKHLFDEADKMESLPPMAAGPRLRGPGDAPV